MRDERKRVDAEDENAVADMLSPVSIEGDKQDDCELRAPLGASMGSSSEGYDFSNVRVSEHQVVFRLQLLIHVTAHSIHSILVFTPR